MAIPERTPEQRADALRKAHRARAERAELRASMREGRIDPVTVLVNWQTNESWGSLPARVWLLSCPGVGEATADRVMSQAGISASRRLRGLGPHQRQTLLEFAQKRAETPEVRP